MKNLIITVLLLASSLAIVTACNDKGANTPPEPTTITTLTVTDIIGNLDGITEINAYYAVDLSITTMTPTKYGEEFVASAPLIDKGFTMELPLEVDESYLQPLAQDQFDEGITLSESFNGVYLVFYGQKLPARTANLIYSTPTDADPFVIGHLLYTDRPITLSGHYKNLTDNPIEYELDITTQKGWQWLYARTEPIVNEEGGIAYIKHINQTTPFNDTPFVWRYVSD